MRRMVAFAMAVCIVLSLAGCKNENTNVSSTVATSNNESKGYSSSVQSSVSVESEVFSEEIKTENEQEIVASSKPAQAVMPEFLNVGKEVVLCGELKNSQYNEKVTKLEEILNGYSYNISLSVYSVDGSKGLEYNTDAEIFGACTVKAAYTLYACKQMESGKGSLDTQLTYEQKHYEPGTGDMQYSPFGTVFTMETALHKSMSISDNVGYLMSVDYFGRDTYNSWISSLGCGSLMIKPTVWSLKTNANDLVKIWGEIYNYFETNTEHSRFLYNSCTNTAGNYATAALDNVEYSHKQGHNSSGDWLSLSDAGIVWKGDSPYIIAILTDAPGPSSYSADVFAQIINIVHNDLF